MGNPFLIHFFTIIMAAFAFSYAITNPNIAYMMNATIAEMIP